jgi:hypothetical protein
MPRRIRHIEAPGYVRYIFIAGLIGMLWLLHSSRSPSAM